MTPAEALGRRALAAGFALADGVVIVGPTGPVRVYGVHEDPNGRGPVFYGAGWIDNAHFWGWDEWRAYWPDFTDAATLGVLEAQVRARIGEEAHVQWDGEGWRVATVAKEHGRLSALRLGPSFPDRASAWVAALEARP